MDDIQIQKTRPKQAVAAIGRLLVLFCLFSLNISASPIINILPSERLTQVTVTSMVEDSNGYLWIGTQGGLNRYDGETLQHYIHDSIKENSISNNYISNLFADNEGNVLVAGKAGAEFWHASNDSFTSIAMEEHSPYFSSTPTARLRVFTRNGLLWSVVNRKLILFQYNTAKTNPEKSEYSNEISTASHASLLSKLSEVTLSNSPQFISLWGDSGISLVTNRRVVRYRYDSVQSHISAIQEFTFPQSITQLSNHKNSAQLFVGRSFSKMIYDDGHSRDLDVSSVVPREQANQLYINSKRQLLVATDNGIYSYQFNDELSEIKASLAQSLKGVSVKLLYENHQHNLIIGTRSHGIYLMNANQPAMFEKYSSSKNGQIKLNDNLIMSLAELPLSVRGSPKNGSKEHLIVAGDGSNSINIIREHKATQAIPAYQVAGALPRKEILSVQTDSSGNIWVASQNGLSMISGVIPSIKKQNMSLEKIRYKNIYRASDKGKAYDYPTQILITKKVNNDEKIWVTLLRGGLMQYDQNSQSLVRVNPVGWPENKIFADYIYRIQSWNNDIWLAGYRGQLIHFDMTNNKAESFSLVDHRNPKLSISRVYNIVKNGDGDLWLSGVGGVGRFRVQDKKFDHMYQLIGEQKDDKSIQREIFSTTYSLIVDKNDAVLFGSKNRLYRATETATGRIKVTPDQTLPIEEFSTASLVDSKGQFWFGSTDGLVRLQSQKTKHLPQLERLTISRCSIHSNSAKNQRCDYNSDKRLTQKIVSADQLQLAFTTFDFANDIFVRYRIGLGSWQLSNSAVIRINGNQLPSTKQPLFISLSYDKNNWTNDHLVGYIAGDSHRLKKSPSLIFTLLMLFIATILVLVIKRVNLPFYGSGTSKEKLTANERKRLNKSVQSDDHKRLPDGSFIHLLPELEKLEYTTPAEELFMEKFSQKISLLYQQPELNLEKLAAAVFLSKRQLTRKVNDATGIPPMEFLKRYRLERCIEQLELGKSLNRVAFEVGFGSQSYFSTCFKKYFGVSPRQYLSNKARNTTLEEDSRTTQTCL